MCVFCSGWRLDVCTIHKEQLPATLQHYLLVDAMSGGFCRPRHKDPTRHLFVGNCGPSLGIDEARAVQIFSPFGPASVSLPDPVKSHLFVSYPTAEQAANALQALNQKACPETGGRSLVIKFADVPREPRPRQQVGGSNSCMRLVLLEGRLSVLCLW